VISLFFLTQVDKLLNAPHILPSQAWQELGSV